MRPATGPKVPGRLSSHADYTDESVDWQSARFECSAKTGTAFVISSTDLAIPFIGGIIQAAVEAGRHDDKVTQGWTADRPA